MIRIKKNNNFEIEQDIDFRLNGGPFIKKGLKMKVLIVRRDKKEVFVDIEEIGRRRLDIKYLTKEIN